MKTRTLRWVSAFLLLLTMLLVGAWVVSKFVVVGSAQGEKGSEKPQAPSITPTALPTLPQSLVDYSECCAILREVLADSAELQRTTLQWDSLWRSCDLASGDSLLIIRVTAAGAELLELSESAVQKLASCRESGFPGSLRLVPSEPKCSFEFRVSAPDSSLELVVVFFEGAQPEFLYLYSLLPGADRAVVCTDGTKVVKHASRNGLETEGWSTYRCATDKLRPPDGWISLGQDGESDAVSLRPIVCGQ